MTDYFHLDAAPDHIRAISNLGLAHLGDAVFEVMVRSWLCLRGKATSKGLHRATVHFVAAPAQAAMAEKILPLLSEEEGDVFRRGRNASPTPSPRRPAGRSTRPPPPWRLCSAGCTSRGGRSGLTRYFRP